VARTVGRYEIREEIGRGGTATVYLACQTDLRRFVALKELSAFSAADPTFARRFVRESWVSASLSHPNVVTVHDYFEADGAPFIAMEYLSNGSLRSRVGALSLGRVAGVLEAMLGGLGHAHAHGVVHRDLKPENVLVTADGDVKIADFGIAKALDSLETALTVTGTTIGTPAYMSPEQAMAGEIGPWTDLYSLGVMAFEMIAGRPPFGDAEPVAILLRHVKDAPPPLTVVAPSTAPALSDWVGRLLEKAPEDRPSSAAEAWEALEEIVLDTLGPRWRRMARLPPQEATQPRPTSARTPSTEPPSTTTGAPRSLHTVAPLAVAEDPRLADTVPPRLPVEAPAAAPAAAAPAAAARARGRHGWRIVVALILVGWALAVLLIGALSGLRSGGSPSSGVQPAATTTTTPAAAGSGDPAAEATATATPAPATTATPTPTPAATATPRDDSGVGDSRSDDPSDDEPDRGEP
jgi:serine/threonine protein kinase